MDRVFWIEIGISAVIAFGATFAGVWLSLRRERRIREGQERSRFGHIIQGLLVEISTCHAVLNNIKQAATADRAFTYEPIADSLRATLNDPLFYQFAEHSLIMAVKTSRVEIAVLNNVLHMHQHAAGARGGMTEAAVRDLRIRAETCQKVLSVAQELLEEALGRFGRPIVADARTAEVRARLQAIMAEGARRILENEGTEGREHPQGGAASTS